MPTIATANPPNAIEHTTLSRVFSLLSGPNPTPIATTPENTQATGWCEGWGGCNIRTEHRTGKGIRPAALALLLHFLARRNLSGPHCVLVAQDDKDHHHSRDACLRVSSRIDRGVEGRQKNAMAALIARWGWHVHLNSSSPPNCSQHKTTDDPQQKTNNFDLLAIAAAAADLATAGVTHVIAAIAHGAVSE